MTRRGGRVWHPDDPRHPDRFNASGPFSGPVRSDLGLGWRRRDNAWRRSWLGSPWKIPR